MAGKIYALYFIKFFNEDAFIFLDDIKFMRVLRVPSITFFDLL